MSSRFSGCWGEPTDVATGPAYRLTDEILAREQVWKDCTRHGKTSRGVRSTPRLVTGFPDFQPGEDPRVLRHADLCVSLGPLKSHRRLGGVDRGHRGLDGGTSR